VFDIANKQAATQSGVLGLGMTSQTKVGIADGEQLWIDRAMGCVAGGAAFAQCRVFENKRTGLFPVTVGTGFVEARHGQAAGWFEDVGPMWIVALNTIHLALGDGMMFREVKLGIDLKMTFVTGLGVLARIDDHFFAAGAAQGDMLAARTMARLTAMLAGHACLLDMQAGVRTGRKDTRNVCVAVGANFVAHKGRSLNTGRLGNGSAGRGTGFD
jgi:hypothetical protein